MLKKFFQNTCKPQGLTGKMMTTMMNNGHVQLADWGFSHLKFAAKMNMLDVGCGGGANLSVLLERCPDGRAAGVDYSEVSVSQSIKKNQAAIEAGRCKVLQASAESLPFKDDTFDLITAFETVYFWPNLLECFRGIHGKLRTGGVFFICNEESDPSNDRWTKIIDGMRIYSAEELKGLLEDAGFADIRLDREKKKGWICLQARKG